MSAPRRLPDDYRNSFLRYVTHGEEAHLHVAYQIGRSALVDGLSVLDLAQLHHDVLIEVLKDTSRDDIARVATAASEFFLEVLATFDMAHRGYPSGTPERRCAP